jgi:hypothetical protein
MRKIVRYLPFKGGKFEPPLKGLQEIISVTSPPLFSRAVYLPFM